MKNKTFLQYGLEINREKTIEKITIMNGCIFANNEHDWELIKSFIECSSKEEIDKRFGLNVVGLWEKLEHESEANYSSAGS